MIIVGMTACGKTHFLLDFLEKEYMKCFDFICLFVQHLIGILLMKTGNITTMKVLFLFVVIKIMLNKD